jgi:hypothetical protein
MEVDGVGVDDHFDEIVQQGEEIATNLQKTVRGREGRKQEVLLKRRAANQRRHDEASNVEVVGLSRGRKGRNTVTNARSQELAAIRIQSIHRGRVGRQKVARHTGLATLTLGMIKKGLKCHGCHPILLKHTFLQLELPVSLCVLGHCLTYLSRDLV